MDAWNLRRKVREDVISYTIFRGVTSHARSDGSVHLLKFVVFASNLCVVTYVKHVI